MQGNDWKILIQKIFYEILCKVNILNNLSIVKQYPVDVFFLFFFLFYFLFISKGQFILFAIFKAK